MAGKMITFDALDDDTLRVLLDHLVRSRSQCVVTLRLVNKRLASLAFEYLFRNLEVDFDILRSTRHTAHIQKITQAGKSKHVRTLKLADKCWDATHRTHDTRQALLRSFADALSLFTGVNHIECDLQPIGYADVCESVVDKIIRHPKSDLHMRLVVARNIHTHVLDVLIHSENLRSLDVTFRDAGSWLTQQRLDTMLSSIKAIVISCRRLKSLTLNLPTMRYQGMVHNNNSLHNRYPFTAEEIARIAALETLIVWDYPFVIMPGFNEIANWADHMDLSRLRSFGTLDGLLLSRIRSRLPELECLIMPNLSSDFQLPWVLRDEEIMACPMMRDLSCLRYLQIDITEDVSLQDALLIQRSCHQLERLCIGLHRENGKWPLVHLNIIAGIKTLRQLSINFETRHDQLLGRPVLEPAVTYDATRDVEGRKGRQLSVQDATHLF